MSVKRDIDWAVVNDLFTNQNLSVKRIADTVGVSRPTIRRVLIEHGITPPSQKEASHRVYANGFRPNTVAAHNAVRGTKRTDEELCKRALFYQGFTRSKYEQLLYEALLRQDEHPVPNLAVFKYCIDLAFEKEKLAVEVDGGNWHGSAKKKRQDAEKTAFLEPLGWEIIRFTNIS